MQVGEKYGIDISAATAGGVEALGHAGAAINKIGAALIANDL
jgi:hypothetical protein